MKLGIPKATNPLERRVATTPSVIKKLHKLMCHLDAVRGKWCDKVLLPYPADHMLPLPWSARGAAS